MYGLFSEAQVEFEKAVDTARSELACVNGTPRAYANEPYALLNGLDDTLQQLGDINVASFLEKVGPEIADKVSRWIDEKKTTMTYLETDHEKMSARTGLTGAVVLAKTCNSYLVHSPPLS